MPNYAIATFEGGAVHNLAICLARMEMGDFGEEIIKHQIHFMGPEKYRLLFDIGHDFPPTLVEYDTPKEVKRAYIVKLFEFFRKGYG